MLKRHLFKGLQETAAQPPMNDRDEQSAVEVPRSGSFDVESDEENDINTPESQQLAMSLNPERPVYPRKVSTAVSILIQSLVKNLCSLYEPDEKQAQKFYQIICQEFFQMNLIDESYIMREFDAVRHQYQRALYNLVKKAFNVNKLPAITLQPFWSNGNNIRDWSHYNHEFDEVEYIAGGGFGQVFRVRHKLDGNDYAVKKIVIRSESIKSVTNYLQEVKTFASMNHTNIVQYKAAWLELGGPSSNNEIDEQETTGATFYSETDSETVSQPRELIGDFIYPQAITDTEIITCNNRQLRDNTNFDVSFQNSVHMVHQYPHSSNSVSEVDRNLLGKSNRVRQTSISEGGNAVCKLEEIKKLQVENRSSMKWATLYIQMALCQSTLKQWLQKRNESVNMRNDVVVTSNLNAVHTESVMEILKQLLRGIEYIHSKGMVHHDIKPSNIFVQIENNQLLIQLGDFGLACPLQSAKHSLAFGTKLYAAPEQLLGKCNRKSDMYSLGIVVFELVGIFSTDMERIDCIIKVRNGKLPDNLSSQQPQLVNVITQLTARNPGDRPDATTLLRNIFTNRDEAVIIQELRSQLAEKDEEISRLKLMLKKASLDNSD